MACTRIGKLSRMRISTRSTRAGVPGSGRAGGAAVALPAGGAVGAAVGRTGSAVGDIVGGGGNSPGVAAGPPHVLSVTAASKMPAAAITRIFIWHLYLTAPSRAHKSPVPAVYHIDAAMAA